MKQQRVDIKGILLLLICLTSIYPLLNVGLVINDDLLIQNKSLIYNFIEVIKQGFEFTKNQGRTNFLGWISYEIPFIFNNFIYFKLVQIGAILVDILLLALLIRKLSDSLYLFYLTLIFSIIGLQNSWEHNPITAFPGQFSIGIMMLLIALYLYTSYFETNKKILMVSSLLFFIYTLFSYEVYVLFSPLFWICSFLIIQKSGNVNVKYLIKRNLPLLYVCIGYVITYVVFRQIFGSNYEGAQIQTTFNLINSLKVIWQFSISALPSYFLFNDKYQYLLYIYSDYFGNKNNFLNLFEPRIEWIIKVSLLLILFYQLQNLQDSQKRSFKKLIFIFFGLLCYIFVPSVLLSLTPAYQTAVLEYEQLGMPVSFFSFFFIVLCLSLIFYISKLFITSKRVRKVIFILECIILAYISLSVDFTNHYISKYQKMSNYKWEVLNQFFDSSDFQNIPDGSIIYAPTLRYQIGSVGISDGYWNDYFKNKTDKKLNIIDKLGEIGTQNFYFLKYVQASKESEQYLIFSKVNKIEGNEYFSDSVSIYNLTKYDDFNILGQINTGAHMTNVRLNNFKNVSTNNLFNFKIVTSDYTFVNKLKFMRLDGSNINLDSIVVISSTNAPLYFNYDT